MKNHGLKMWLMGVLMAGSVIPVSAALTTNVWNSTLGGKWEATGDWSTGFAPSNNQTAVVISNGFFSALSPSKAVAIDSTTASSFPGTMTISNLTISAPTVRVGLQTEQGLNELIITNAAAKTFTVLNTLLLTTGSVMLLSNSTAVVNSQLIDNGYLELDPGALLTTTPPSVSYVGYDRVAQMAVTGGVWQTGTAYVGYNSGSQGLVEFSSGTIAVSDESILYVGYNAGANGFVTITGGQLILTNASIELGYEGSGAMTISNGTVLGSINVCGFDGFGTGAGTLTVAGGTVTGNVDVSFGESTGVGSVWLTGGQIINESTLYLGDQGIGQMTVSNGTLVTEGLEIGYFTGSQGTLTIAGGTNVFSSFVHVGRGGTHATVWMTGGLLFTTNDLTNVGDQGGVAQVIVSNGMWQSQRIRVGSSPEAVCPLTLDGGVIMVSSNLQIGLFDCSTMGIVTVAGGALYVTNATHDAALDVETGTFALESGTVIVDQFIMTNTCASFVRTGGTLVYGTAILNPSLDADGDGIPNGYEQAYGLDPLDPTDAATDNDGDGFSNRQEYLAGTDPTNNASYLHITSVVPSGSDLRVTWMMGPGKTNALQRTSGVGDGSYQTNGFADIFIVTNTVGTVTNYVDVGGATNVPSRFYRVRLVP